MKSHEAEFQQLLSVIFQINIAIDCCLIILKKLRKYYNVQPICYKWKTMPMDYFRRHCVGDIYHLSQVMPKVGDNNIVDDAAVYLITAPISYLQLTYDDVEYIIKYGSASVVEILINACIFKYNPHFIKLNFVLNVFMTFSIVHNKENSKKVIQKYFSKINSTESHPPYVNMDILVCNCANMLIHNHLI